MLELEALRALSSIVNPLKITILNRFHYYYGYLKSSTLVIIRPKIHIILMHSLDSTLICAMPKSRKCFLEIHIEQVARFKKIYSDRF